MLDRPDLEDALIVAALRDAFGLDVADVVFLPLGADVMDSFLPNNVVEIAFRAEG